MPLSSLPLHRRNRLLRSRRRRSPSPLAARDAMHTSRNGGGRLRRPGLLSELPVPETKPRHGASTTIVATFQRPPDPPSSFHDDGKDIIASVPLEKEENSKMSSIPPSPMVGVSVPNKSTFPPTGTTTQRLGLRHPESFWNEPTRPRSSPGVLSPPSSNMHQRRRCRSSTTAAMDALDDEYNALVVAAGMIATASRGSRSRRPPRACSAPRISEPVRSHGDDYDLDGMIRENATDLSSLKGPTFGEEEEDTMCTRVLMMDPGTATRREPGMTRDDDDASPSSKERSGKGGSRHQRRRDEPAHGAKPGHRTVTGTADAIVVPGAERAVEESFETNDTSLLTLDSSFFSSSDEQAHDETDWTDWMVERDDTGAGVDVFLSIIFCHAI